MLSVDRVGFKPYLAICQDRQTDVFEQRVATTTPINTRQKLSNVMSRLFIISRLRVIR